MAPTLVSLRIHPAIGIARVGNSPDEYFIGPEKLAEPDPPPGAAAYLREVGTETLRPPLGG